MYRLKEPTLSVGIRRREHVICFQRRTENVWRWLWGESNCDKMTDREGHGGIIKREQENSSKVWWMSEIWQYTAIAALLHWSVLIRDKDKKHKTRVHCELNTPTESSVQSWLKVRKECEFDLGKTKTICTDMRAPKLYTRWFKYDRDWFLCKQAALRSSCATLREWSHNLHPPSCSG